MVTEFAGSKVMVPSGSRQSQFQLLDLDHCEPVQSNLIDRETLSLGVGPSIADATHFPDEQSVVNSYVAV